MNKNEFDIQVRNILQDAQESVSPSVWEGVQAGLARKRRAAAFWRWTGAVAAAAAIFSGVVLLWPVAEPNHSNPIIIAETSPEDILESPVVQEDVFPAEETVVEQVPVRRPVRLAQMVKASAPENPAADETPAAEVTPAADASPAVTAAPAAAVEAVPETAVPEQIEESADQSLFNRLAYEDSKNRFDQDWSLAVSGNLEDRRRGTVKSSVAPHFYSAPPLGAQEGIYNESPEVSFSLPFSAGIGVNWQFHRHWAVGVGLRYTNLSRTFVGDYVGNGFRCTQTDIDNHQHWLGIPLNVYYVFVDSGRWRVHTFAGGSMEFLADNNYLIHGAQKDIHFHQRGATPPQFSAGLGLGVDFKLTPWLGLYLDPAFRYYFRPDLQPRSLRTIQPLRFDIEAGLRFSLGK